ncbi:MATE family efflux transporter [uncultured Ruthenibacterium sp.]|uniref:MATE family efflux transporter n=1 Tax=uncultured Ruthenibacterium sp. TaxID=1905347 RepID=UPI00349ECE9E
MSQRGNIDMTSGGICGRILRFSAPLAAGNLFQQVYSLTDAAIVGRCVGVDALAAIGCTSWLQWLVFAVCRDGANALCIAASQRVGARDADGLRRITAHGTVLGGVLALCILAPILLFLNPILQFFNVPDNIYADAKIYLTVLAVSVPLIVIYDAAAALLQAAGDSRCTFYAMLCSTVTNISLDLLFVAVFRWGVLGAALATALAQLVSALIALVTLLRRDAFTMERRFWRPDREILRELVRLWLPMFWNSVIIAAGGMVVQKQINTRGAAFSGGISAGVKLFNLIEAVIMGIQSGTCIFIGQNLGARQIRRARTGLVRITGVAEILSAVMILCVWLWGDRLLSVLMWSQDPATAQQALKTAWDSIRVLSLGVLIMTPMYLHRGAVQTLGYTIYSMIAGCLQMVVRILTIRFAPPVLGDLGYYLPDVAAWAVSLVVVFAAYQYHIRKLSAKEKQPA